jgi:hypothetical protein
MQEGLQFLLKFAMESSYTKIWVFESGGVLCSLTLSTTFT